MLVQINYEGRLFFGDFYFGDCEMYFCIYTSRNALLVLPSLLPMLGLFSRSTDLTETWMVGSPRSGNLTVLIQSKIITPFLTSFCSGQFLKTHNGHQVPGARYYLFTPRNFSAGECAGFKLLLCFEIFRISTNWMFVQITTHRFRKAVHHLKEI